MKSSAFLNGMTLQDFFPLISKLSQQIRLPVTVLDVVTTGPGNLAEVGLVEVSTITIAPSGSVSAHSTLVDPELPIQQAATKAHGLRAGDLVGAPKFPIVYDSLSRTFSSTLVVGFNSAKSTVPVIYGNKVRYGLPIMSARHQLDIQSVLDGQGKVLPTLGDIAKHYSATPGTARRSAGNVLTMARVLENMLWRHGSDAVLACITNSTTSYLTPEEVLGAAAVDQAPAAPVKGSTGSKKPARNESAKPAEWIAPLKLAIEKIVSAHGVVRPIHLPEIADAMGWNESRTSIEIGRLLTRGKLNPDPFVIAEQQEILNYHLPFALKEMKDVKLKAVREAIKELTGHDVEYIQIRLALKKLNRLHD